MQINWVCYECGIKYGNHNPGEGTTWHEGDSCDICGEVKATTAPRDFGYWALKPIFISKHLK